MGGFSVAQFHFQLMHAILGRLQLFHLGAQPVSQERATPANFGKYFRDEAAKWAPIIKAAGVFAD